MPQGAEPGNGVLREAPILRLSRLVSGKSRERRSIQHGQQVAVFCGFWIGNHGLPRQLAVGFSKLNLKRSPQTTCG
jgi:hypothetical protein